MKNVDSMTLDLLVSCMNMNDFSIVEKSRICSNSVIVNQCDEEKVCNERMISADGKSFDVRMLYTEERGLSRSRNMAIRNSSADICLLVDDDEHFMDDYETSIVNAFCDYPDVDVIAFRVLKSGKKYKESPYRIRRFGSAHIASWQIAFRRERVLEKGVWFDEKMGSGTGNGGGEENKFVYQLICRGLKAMYLPITIASVDQLNSQWSHGLTEVWFKNLGWVFRRIYGTIWGYVFIWYHITKHRFTTHKNVPLWFVVKNMHIGFFDER